MCREEGENKQKLMRIERKERKREWKKDSTKDNIHLCIIVRLIQYEYMRMS